MASKHRATTLTAADIAELRGRAGQEAGPFVDPHRSRRIQSWWKSDLCEWASVIVGAPVTALRALSWQKMVLLDLAHDREPTPPPPPELTARLEEKRAVDEQRHQVERADREAAIAAWDALRAALPIHVSVAFNYSRHTYEFHHHGGHHIVTWDNVQVGRLRRTAGKALCATPSRSRGLHLDNAALERREQDKGHGNTVPTCQACLQTATRLAERSSTDPSGT